MIFIIYTSLHTSSCRPYYWPVNQLQERSLATLICAIHVAYRIQQKSKVSTTSIQCQWTRLGRAHVCVSRSRYIYSIDNIQEMFRRWQLFVSPLLCKRNESKVHNSKPYNWTWPSCNALGTWPSCNALQGSFGYLKHFSTKLLKVSSDSSCKHRIGSRTVKTALFIQEEFRRVNPANESYNEGKIWRRME